MYQKNLKCIIPKNSVRIVRSTSNCSNYCVQWWMEALKSKVPMCIILHIIGVKI